jgi:predicted RNase H-like HicB family nuclease
MASAPQKVFYSRLEDGTYLAASIGVPRFCVAAPTRAEVREKAEQAIAYYNEAKGAIQHVKPRSTQVISPAFEPEELCV